MFCSSSPINLLLKKHRTEFISNFSKTHLSVKSRVAWMNQASCSSYLFPAAITEKLGTRWLSLTSQELGPFFWWVTRVYCLVFWSEVHFSLIITAFFTSMVKSHDWEEGNWKSRKRSSVLTSWPHFLQVLWPFPWNTIPSTKKERWGRLFQTLSTLVTCKLNSL